MKIKYNAPCTLTFCLVSLGVLILQTLLPGITTLLFCVYRSPLTSFFTYPRFFLHVLGHSGISHYMGNILLLLIVGPPLEEKFGSKNMFRAIVITAFISGLVQYLFFPGTALMGASGIVFMMIVMISMTGKQKGSIPLTMILVIIFYVGNEIITGITTQDNVSQLTHVIGGACGAVIGNGFYKNKYKR